ncbi:hypothetical protein SE19_04495 [Acidiplasma aeolicum]|jgi:V/A-type H+-transporting ATPase subunit E|uniref:V-type proton ATPase subunit E n=1 Tax=Acidiplasma aeolicum TaxID=507754 RepID=A0A0P9CLP3_9ARCH|nr:AMP nucleosidase [Acidiplasma aeolicum]KPV46675.1 hypothetical protein SE19_04495 [Acidiplasma aeolicum]
MSLESILNEIDRSREDEIQKINQYYEEQIKNVREACNKKIKELQEYYALKQKDDSKLIIKQYEDQIKIQTKQILDNKKKEIINSALDKAKSYITSLNKSSRYPELLEIMVDTSIKKLGKDIIVECSESDMEKIKAMNKVNPKNVEANSGIKSGIIAYSPDRLKMLDLTLNTIFKEISDDILAYFYENVK